jgi:hypothetical protein
MDIVSPRVATEDLIDARDVADVLGLSHRNTVFQYQRRYDDSPDRSSIWARVASSSGSDLRSSDGRLAPLLKVPRVVNAVPVGDRVLSVLMVLLVCSVSTWGSSGRG